MTSATTKGDYALIPEDSEKLEGLPNGGPPRARRDYYSRLSIILQSGTFILAAITLAMVIIIIIIAPTTPRATLPHGPIASGIGRMNPPTRHVRPCGDNAAAARANGCVFEVMSMAWVHPDCFDKELHDRFLEVASEPFFEDMAGTKPIPDYEVLSERADTSYTTRRYHVFHCSFSWRQVHRALDRGMMVDSRLAGYGHTEHCTKNLMNNSIPWDQVATTVNIVFPDC